MMEQLQQCYHIIRCVVTPEDRSRVEADLHRARSSGDVQATNLALAQLSGPCTRSANSTPNLVGSDHDGAPQVP